jgi:hypothetical protein
MLLTITLVLLAIAAILGYVFGGTKGAIGSFFTSLFLFGMPIILYVIMKE